MPLLIYRKSIRETSVYAEAETEAKAKSFIPKYGETRAFTLEANFAIKLLDEVLRDYVHSRYASITKGLLSMPCIPILFSKYLFSSFYCASDTAISFAFFQSFALIKHFLSFNQSNFYFDFSAFIIH